VLSGSAVQAQLAQRIEDITTEITQWLPELGEAALMALYDERGRWADLLTSLKAKECSS